MQVEGDQHEQEEDLEEGAHGAHHWAGEGHQHEGWEQSRELENHPDGQQEDEAVREEDSHQGAWGSPEVEPDRMVQEQAYQQLVR